MIDRFWRYKIIFGGGQKYKTLDVGHTDVKVHHDTQLLIFSKNISTLILKYITHETLSEGNF